MEQGMQVDPQILIQTQSNFITQSRVKEVQMEAAIQQLIAENTQLRARVEVLEDPDHGEVKSEQE